MTHSNPTTQPSKEAMEIRLAKVFEEKVGPNGEWSLETAIDFCRQEITQAKAEGAERVVRAVEEQQRIIHECTDCFDGCNEEDLTEADYDAVSRCIKAAKSAAKTM